MNRSGPVLAEVMNGTYERSRPADKGSYERVMNGNFLCTPQNRSPATLPRPHMLRQHYQPHMQTCAPRPDSLGRCKASEKRKCQLPQLSAKRTLSQMKGHLIDSEPPTRPRAEHLRRDGAKTRPGSVDMRRDLATCTPSMWASQRPRAVLQKLVLRGRKKKSGRNMGSYEEVMNGATPALNDRKL
jgi:hypothetical protein